jgi:hypothetical protein
MAEISPLRRYMIEDRTIRNLSPSAQDLASTPPGVATASGPDCSRR